MKETGSAGLEKKPEIRYARRAMWVYLEMTEDGGLTLPPEALKAFGGAQAVTAEKKRSGSVVLRPAAPGAPGAAPVSAAGELILPPNALEAVKEWPAWDGLAGWDGRNLEVRINQEDRRLTLSSAPNSGIKALRRRIAELNWTEEDIGRAVKEARRETYEEDQKAAREAAGAAQRKAV